MSTLHPTQLAAGSSSRKGKERHAPQPTDIAERMMLFQRKQAHVTKPKERTDRVPPLSSSSTRPPTHPSSPHKLHAPPPNNPSIVVSQPSPTPDGGPDESEFSRRLKISSSRSPKAESETPRGAGRLYNPHTDSVRRPMVVQEPDVMSDGASSSYAPRGPLPSNSRSHQRSQSSRPNGDAPRLFDPRKDDPHQFGVLARPQGFSGSAVSPNLGRAVPTSKSSGDWVSASSTSSYAQSTISSNFTLSSATTDSSAGSALFDSNARRSEDSSSSANALSIQLKKLYRQITMLESRILGEDKDSREDDNDRDTQRSGVVMMGRQINSSSRQEPKGGDEEAEKEWYRRLVTDHKELAETMHRMLTLTLAPSVPPSLRNIPTKYQIIGRLWNHAFHRLLESLRRASMPPSSSDVALEQLQEFIYYAYTFYGNLIEEQNLSVYRSGWIESLGDLARYRMAVSVMVENATMRVTPPANAITRAALSANHLAPGPGTPDASALSGGNISPIPAVSPTPAARIDDSPPASAGPQQQANNYAAPSVGIVAARRMELEPEKERWRQISRQWYSKGVALTPGAGKLHHHLGLLARDKDGGEEELRAVYHFVKSMITLHPFPTSREAVLPIWSGAAQARRQAPDAGLAELFVHLHGMLFTNIQLDDWQSVLARFKEKLLIEGAEVEDREWIMMAIVNIGSILEYGRPTGILRRVSGIMSREAGGPSVSPGVGNGRVKVVLAKRGDGEDRAMDIDDDADGANGVKSAANLASPALSDAMPTDFAEPEITHSLKLAMQLTFSMLSYVLARPTRPAGPLGRDCLNPYLSIILTFLATFFKDKIAERVLSRAFPWEALAKFLTRAPRKVMQQEMEKDPSISLSGGCRPLPEDWCLRGLGWSGKRIYERGFWDKELGSEDRTVEAEVLDRCDAPKESKDGVIEDEDDKSHQEGRAELHGRWTRIARAAFKLGRMVNGFVYNPPMQKDGRGEWAVQGALADKVAKWREEERREKEDEERRLRRLRWDDDSMDVDDDENAMTDDLEDDSDEDQDDSDEVRELKARRRYLRSLLQASQVPKPTPKRARDSTPRKPAGARLRVVPGYTTLVFDTNILLSSLSIISTLVETLQWTIVIPLPVIMELDGLASNASPLGEAAQAAMTYITMRLRSHNLSLKVQTSKGNYLSNLNIRTEQLDFSPDDVTSHRNMDDLILRAAIWQNEHWTDRSSFLRVYEGQRDTTNASKVVLLSFDRMLRLKARSREVDAADERDLAAILAARP